MRWPLIFLLSLHGVVMGILSVMGMVGGIEFWVWMGFAAALIPALGFLVKRLPLANGFVVGLLGGALHQAMIIALFSVYLENNPAEMEAFSRRQSELDPRLFLAILTLPISMMWGLFIGAGALIVFKLRKPPPVGGSGLP